VIGSFSFLFLSASFILPIPHIVVMLAKDEGGFSII